MGSIIGHKIDYNGVGALRPILISRPVMMHSLSNRKSAKLTTLTTALPGFHDTATNSHQSLLHVYAN